MITKWTIENFKSFREEFTLSLAPLTVLAGANSSGKSSVIQSVLMVAQTLRSNLAMRSVLLNGELVQLGTFDDIRNSDAGEEAIAISWHMSVGEEPSHGSGLDRELYPWRVGYYHYSRDAVGSACRFAFRADTQAQSAELQQLQPDLITSKLTGLASGAATEGAENALNTRGSSITVERSAQPLESRARGLGIDVGAAVGAGPIASLLFAVQLDRRSMQRLLEEHPTAEPAGCLMRQFLPAQLAVSIDRAEEDARTVAEVLCGGEAPAARSRRAPVVPEPVLQFLSAKVPLLEPVVQAAVDRQPSLFEDESPSGLSVRDWFQRLRQLPFRERRVVVAQIAELREEIEALLRPQAPHRVLIPQPLPRLLDDAYHQCIDYFTASVKYLGPLRDQPRPLYPIEASADPTDIGRRGEHTAAVLERHKRVTVTYAPSSCFEAEQVVVRTQRRPLQEAVVDWLRYLGVAENVRTRDKGKLGHELQVAIGGSHSLHDLTHVGVGVSQVLPIVVMVLLAREDCTLVFEQPELHLHPRVQTRLADFFLAAALQRRQCIIETHSEYLISRLRQRIAASSDEAVASAIRLYFLEHDGRSTQCREVQVNRYGAIADWPRGFFDESAREADRILMAAAAKRRQENRGG